MHTPIMPKHHGDLTGRRFEKLVVQSCVTPTGHRRWLCRCDCGAQKAVDQYGLISGKTVDCGCGERARRSSANRTHGATLNGKKTPTYESWRAMKMRCDMPTNVAYHRYGGRGIKICERWRDFANFVADMGERPEGATLDRIDFDGHYEPGNCQWATMAEQGNNKSCNYVFQTPDGPMTTTELADRFGIRRQNVTRWARWGWTGAEMYARASKGPLPKGSHGPSRAIRQPD